MNENIKDFNLLPTVILPGYICDIKRAGLTLHRVVQTVLYDRMQLQYMLRRVGTFYFYSGVNLQLTFNSVILCISKNANNSLKCFKFQNVYFIGFSGK